MEVRKKLYGKATRQSGFTLIELLVVIGILAILLSITLIAINPNKHFEDSRNTQRQSNVSEILNAVYEYESSHNGNLPADIQGLTPGELVELCEPDVNVTCVSRPGGTLDLCGDVTPTYLADMPTDPSSGLVDGGKSPCGSGTTGYDTGYTLELSTGSTPRITIAAQGEDGIGTISVTR